MKSGRNPTMRHAVRKHRVSLVWLHERVKQACVDLIYEDATKQVADVSTKAFADAGMGQRPCVDQSCFTWHVLGKQEII